MADMTDTARTRRHFLAATVSLAGGIGLAPVLGLRPAGATPEAMQDAIRKTIGEVPVRKGKVTLDLPPLVENGHTVAMTVKVDSPMTEKDHVRRIHVFNEKNPLPNVVTFYLGPRAGRASISTRIRLADTQLVVAIAEMSDGSLWSDEMHVVVTIAACTEELG